MRSMSINMVCHTLSHTGAHFRSGHSKQYIKDVALIACENHQTFSILTIHIAVGKNHA